MVDLANQSKGKPIPLNKVAKRQGVKTKYLEQIFLKLHHAKLIESKKGPGGGYFIARDPKTIKLSEIMEAVGESNTPVFCVAKTRTKYCPRSTHCPTRPYWLELRMIIDTFFETYTLEDVCKEKRGFYD